MSKALVEKIRSAIQESIAYEAEGIRVHDQIASMIREKYAGKKYTKRFADDLRVRMNWPDTAIVRFVNDYGLNQIEVFRVAPWFEFGDRVGFYLRSSVGDLEAFEAADIAHGSAAKERQAQRIALLNNPKAIAQICLAGERYQNSKATIDRLLEHGGDFTADRYTIEKIVKGES